MTELLVVLVLLGMILAMAFTGLRVVQRGQNDVEREAQFSRDIGVPLQIMETIVMQNLQIANAGPYDLVVFTDQDSNNVREKHEFRARADGRLTQRVTEVNNFGAEVRQLRNVTWSTTNANRTRSEPMFRYFQDATDGGAEISGTNEAAIRESARNVNITIVAVHQGRIIRDSRQVFFRN